MTHDTAKDVKLANMRPGEETLMVIKRHWIILIMLLLYFIAGLVFTAIFYNVPIIPTLGAHLGVIIFWMIFSIFLYIKWLDHELDMYVITNNRIIGVEQISFLNRKVSECNLGQVQEVGSHTKGFFANMLNYGTVAIQTAGNATNFQMTFSPRPLENSRQILNVVDHYRDSHSPSKQTP